MSWELMSYGELMSGRTNVLDSCTLYTPRLGACILDELSMFRQYTLCIFGTHGELSQFRAQH